MIKKVAEKDSAVEFLKKAVKTGMKTGDARLVPYTSILTELWALG